MEDKEIGNNADLMKLGGSRVVMHFINGGLHKERMKGSVCFQCTLVEAILMLEINNAPLKIGSVGLWDVSGMKFLYTGHSLGYKHEYSVLLFEVSRIREKCLELCKLFNYV